MQHPILEVDTSRMSFILIRDTLEIPQTIRIERDFFKLREYVLDIEWEVITSYKLDIFPGAFTDIYGLTHDTTSFSFQTRDPEFYGRILLNLTGVLGQKIIQVFNNKDVLVKQSIIQSDGEFIFDYMNPETFTLKLIHDRNENGMWDTGDYLERRQPEAVEFYSEPISIRSNFDMEVNWDLSQEDDDVLDTEESVDSGDAEETGETTDPER
jgi:hypothetical protein